MLNIAVKPGWLIIDNMLQNKVGHVDYGVYNSLFSLCSLFSVFYDLGLSHFSAQNISRDNNLFNSLFPSLFVVRLTALLLFPVIITLSGYFMGYEGEQLWWLFLLAVSANLFHFALFFRAKLQAFQYFRLDSVASVLQKLILIIVVAIMFGYGISIEKYLIIEVCSHILVFIILLALIVKLFGWIKLKFDFTRLKDVIVRAFPFAIMTLLYSVSAKVDVVMLERMWNDSDEAGLYSGAVRLFDAGMMYPWVLMPMFFAKFAAYDLDWKKAGDLLRVGVIVMFLPILALSCVFVFESEPLFVLFKDSSVEEKQTMMQVLAILALAFIIHGLSVVYGTFLNASGYVKKVNLWVGISLAVNIIINILLIPKFGALATAWSTVVSTAVLMVGYIILIRSKTQLVIYVSLLVRLLVLGVLVFGSMYLWKRMELVWYLNWASIALFTAIFALLLGLGKKELYNLEE